MQHDLFSVASDDIWQQIDAPDADIRFAPAFLDARTAKAYFDELMEAISWRQDKIRVYGKLHDVPRLHQWYGDPGTEYIWSGLIMQPQPWISPLLRIKSLIERATSATYNSLLANLYRNGDDAVGWHSDDEPDFKATRR
ncbi:alpha-ketoglutarate-dependent dioxygenase AlkB family protein [Nannocystis pusilla]|uniref:alpha-ketoglutarate-dependent dioxygenase AlkB family protein n=1 Tax=Nannocystis pusilla TaxID=889268 RepID=UPI003B7C3EEC